MTGALTAINLAQTALTSGFPHVEGLLSRPDLGALPPARRYMNFALEGAHWTVLMLAFTSVYQGLDGAFDVAIWVCAGVFFAGFIGFLAERNLR